MIYATKKLRAEYAGGLDRERVKRLGGISQLKSMSEEARAALVSMAKRKMDNPNMGTVKLTKDGREIVRDNLAGRKEYRKRIAQMWERDGHTCCLCGQPIELEQCTFEHKNGRGGGKRDDRIAGNGVAHYFGNAAKGSVSYTKYMALPLEKRIKNCSGH